jgi:hypothetical protein
MKYSKFFCLLFLLKALSVIAQTNQTYFSTNSINLNSSDQNTLIDRDLANYNGFFIGEEHDDPSLSSKCILIQNYILKNKKIDYVFFEAAYRFVEEYNAFNSLSKLDTSSNELAYYSIYDKVNEQIFKNIYRYNLNNSKITVIPIDETELYEMDDDFILNNFELSDKLRPVEIRDDLVDFIKIFKFLEKKSKRQKRYLKFIQNFKEHDKMYKEYLKENYFELKNTLDGIEVAINDKKLLGDLYYKSFDREKYMFNNILHYADSTRSFISFNGQFHIPVSLQAEYLGINNWESLACKYNSFSNGKACSFYLLNLQEDEYFTDTYKVEKELIKEHIKQGETLLIKLDSENTPFSILKDKYQYILAW